MGPPKLSRCCTESDALNSPHLIESLQSRRETEVGLYWCYPQPALLRSSKSARTRAHPAEKERSRRSDHLPTLGGNRSDRTGVPIARRAPWPAAASLGRRRFLGQNQERPRAPPAPPDHCRDRTSLALCRSIDRGFPEARRDRPTRALPACRSDGYRQVARSVFALSRHDCLGR